MEPWVLRLRSASTEKLPVGIISRAERGSMTRSGTEPVFVVSPHQAPLGLVREKPSASATALSIAWALFTVS